MSEGEKINPSIAPQTKVYGHQSLIILWAFVKPSPPVQIENSLYYKMCLKWAWVGDPCLCRVGACSCRHDVRGRRTGGGLHKYGGNLMRCLWFNISFWVVFVNGVEVRIVEGVYVAHNTMIEGFFLVGGLICRVCCCCWAWAEIRGCMLSKWSLICNFSAVLNLKQMKGMCSFWVVSFFQYSFFIYCYDVLWCWLHWCCQSESRWDAYKGEISAEFGEADAIKRAYAADVR